MVGRLWFILYLFPGGSLCPQQPCHHCQEVSGEKGLSSTAQLLTPLPGNLEAKAFGLLSFQISARVNSLGLCGFFLVKSLNLLTEEEGLGSRRV